jgi:hypothetical protein
MTVPLISLHKAIANSDFPEAVGPAITIAGLETFISILSTLFN